MSFPGLPRWSSMPSSVKKRQAASSFRSALYAIGLEGILVPNQSLPVLGMLPQHPGVFHPPQPACLIEYKARCCHLAN
jgi:hypothetical protein